MMREEFRQHFIINKQLDDTSNAIPGEVIKFVLWRGFNGNKRSFSWQRSHEDLPLFKTFGASPIPIVDFTFQKKLRLKIFQSKPEDIDLYTIEDLEDGSLILDPQYKDNGQNFLKGFYMAFSQSLRNSIAHGIFGLCNKSPVFADGQETIAFVLKIKAGKIKSLFTQWMSFSTNLLNLQDGPSVVKECLQALGFDAVISNRCVLSSYEKAKKGWEYCFPSSSLQQTGSDKERRVLASNLMKRRERTLVVFPYVGLTEPNGRNYLYIDEWLRLMKSNKAPKSIMNILRRVGYEN